MEQGVYYGCAEDALQRSIYLVHIITLLFTLYNYYNKIITRWQTLGGRVTNFITGVQEKLQRIRDRLDSLLFLFSWVKTYGELALLYAEDLSVFIRRRNRFQPVRYRHIDDLGRRDCYSWFGLSHHDLRRLFVHWRTPDTFRTSSGSVFGGEKCFLIMLLHMIKGTPFTDMARHTFGGDPRRMLDMFDLMIGHLYFTFYNKISGTSFRQWIPQHLHRCR